MQGLYKRRVTCCVYFAEFRSDIMRVTRRSIVISQSSGLIKYAQTDLFILSYNAGSTAYVFIMNMWQR